MTTESNIGNPASLVKEPKKIRLLDKEVDNGFPWSKNSSACTKVLKSIIGNKLCRDFLDEPKAEDFDDYEIFVQEPLSLRMLQKRIQGDSGSKQNRVKKLSVFINMFRMIFVNALKYWRQHADLRLQIYEILKLFKRLLYNAVPGLKKVFAKNLSDERELAVCREVIDDIVFKAADSLLVLPSSAARRKRVIGDFETTLNLPPHTDSSILKVVANLNYERYVDVTHFYNDASKTLANWIEYYKRKSLPESNVARLAKRLLKHFQSSMQVKFPDLALSEDKIEPQDKSTTGESRGSGTGSKSASMNSSALGSSSKISEKLVTAMELILRRLQKLDPAKKFHTPLNVKKYPKFGRLVSKPMDFGRISQNVQNYKENPREFVSDCVLVFDNCAKCYKDQKSEIRILCAKMRDTFEKLRKKHLDGLIKKQMKEFENGVEDSSQPKDSDEVSKSSASDQTDAFPEKSKATEILKLLVRLDTANAFRNPVDWKGLGLDNYTQIVKKPMDLGTVQEKLSRNQYRDIDAFVADIRLIFSNCRLYNKSDVPEYPILRWCSEMVDALEEALQRLGITKSKGKGNVEDSATGKKSSDTGNSESDRPLTSKNWRSECRKIWAEMKALPAAHPFLVPVRSDELEGYFDIIKHPMDFQTVGSRLKTHTSPDQFAEDMRLVFDNALLYNAENPSPEYPVRTWAKEMREGFDQRYQERIKSGSTILKDSTTERNGIAKAAEKPLVDQRSNGVVSGDKASTKRPSDSKGLDKDKFKKKRRANVSPEKQTINKAVPEPQIGRSSSAYFVSPPEPTRQLAPYESSCRLALLKLARTDWGNAFFGRPVLETFPDLKISYLKVIKNPMDLRTILQQLYDGSVYSDSTGVDKDVRLMFDNALQYNTDDGSLATKQLLAKFQFLQSYWENLFAERPESDAEERTKRRIEREKALAEEPLNSKAALRVLKKLMHARLQKINFFSFPVDTSIYTDYLDIVSEPMDLGTLKANVQNSQYDCPAGTRKFIEHARLVFSNCLLYNPDHPKNEIIRNAAKSMSNVLETEWGKLTVDWLSRTQRTALIERIATELEIEKQILNQYQGSATAEERAAIEAAVIAKRQEERTKPKPGRGRKPAMDLSSEAFADADSVGRGYDSDDDIDSEFEPNHGHGAKAPRFDKGRNALGLGSTFHDMDLFDSGEAMPRKIINDVLSAEQVSAYHSKVEEAKVLALERVQRYEKHVSELRSKERNVVDLATKSLTETEDKSMNHLKSEAERINSGIKLCITLNRARPRLPIVCEPFRDCDTLTDESLDSSQWSSKVLQSIDREASHGKVKALNKPAVETLSNSRTFTLRCAVPFTLMRDTLTGKLQLPNGSSSADSGQGLNSFPSTHINGSSASISKPRKKGKQLRLVEQFLPDSLTAQIFQRVLPFNGIKLCIGTIFLTPYSREDGLRRDESLGIEYEYGTDLSRKVQRRHVREIGRSSTLNGAGPVTLLPTPKIEQKEASSACVSILFRVETSSEFEKQKFFEIRQLLDSCRVSADSDVIMTLDEDGMEVRRYLEEDGRSDFLNEKLSDDFWESWTHHNNILLVTSSSEYQERGSRPYVATKYIGIAGRIAVECESTCVLTF